MLLSVPLNKFYQGKTERVKQKCFVASSKKEAGCYLLMYTVCLCELIITACVNFMLPCDPGSLKAPNHIRP